MPFQQAIHLAQHNYLTTPLLARALVFLIPSALLNSFSLNLSVSAQACCRLCILIAAMTAKAALRKERGFFSCVGIGAWMPIFLNILRSSWLLDDELS